MTSVGVEKPTGPHRLKKALVWFACGLVAPAIVVVLMLPAESWPWAALGSWADVLVVFLFVLSWVCLVGWLVAGMVLLGRWRREIDSKNGTGTHGLRQSVTVWAAWAGAWVLYGILLPAAFVVWIVPGNSTGGRVVAIAVEVYLLFWLVGMVMVIASRRGWLRPT